MSATAASPAKKKTPIFFLKTKSSPHDGYEEYFSAPHRAFAPYFVPVLEHKYNEPNLRYVKELFTSGDITRKYGGLIFTSQRAVEGFAGVIKDVGGMSWQGRKEKRNVEAHLTNYVEKSNWKPHIYIYVTF